MAWILVSFWSYVDRQADLSDVDNLTYFCSCLQARLGNSRILETWISELFHSGVTRVWTHSRVICNTNLTSFVKILILPLGRSGITLMLTLFLRKKANAGIPVQNPLAFLKKLIYICLHLYRQHFKEEKSIQLLYSFIHRSLAVPALISPSSGTAPSPPEPLFSSCICIFICFSLVFYRCSKEQLPLLRTITSSCWMRQIPDSRTALVTDNGNKIMF